MKEKIKKLRPVVFIEGRRNFFRPNLFQQNLLLEAMQVTVDPKKLRQMAGLKSVAEVYRTLDKLAMRKEYHEALVKNGVDFDFLVKGFKDIADTAGKDSDRLRALQSLLKSVGMADYEEQDSKTGKTWEELLVAASEKEEQLRLNVGKSELNVDEDYEVIEPIAPASETRKIEEETEIGKSLYEDE